MDDSETICMDSLEYKDNSNNLNINIVIKYTMDAKNIQDEINRISIEPEKQCISEN